MFQTTTTLTRENTSATWPAGFDAATKSYIQTAYVATGKLVNKTSTVSPDGLTKTVVRQFVNEAAANEWATDITLLNARAARRSALVQNNISRSMTTATI